jgi:integrase
VAREDSPHIVGDYWLDKRDDGASPDIWQIAWYDPDKRRNRYRSTRCRDVAEAKQVIEAHLTRINAHAPKNNDAEVSVVVELLRYYDEHGCETIDEQETGAISSILRSFIAFLKQDEAGIACKFTELTPAVWARWHRWRSKPHSYSIVWKGKEYSNSSAGLADASLKKNIQIIMAALNHAVEEKRATIAPGPGKKLTSKIKPKRRDRVLSMAELSAMIGFARSDEPLWHFILLQLATAMRPEAALKFIVEDQFKPEFDLLDLQPKDAPLTKKRNPVVPAISGISALMEGWTGPWVKDEDGNRFKRLTTRWNTMREVLGFGPDVVPKTIRHTVASMLEWNECDETQISRLMGHIGENSTSAIYKHYNPKKMASVKAGLTDIWDEVNAAADAWCAKFAVANGEKGKLTIVERAGLDVQPDHFTRLNVAQGMTAEEREAAAEKRRKQINAARNARRAKTKKTAEDAVKHLKAA